MQQRVIAAPIAPAPHAQRPRSALAPDVFLRDSAPISLPRDGRLAGHGGLPHGRRLIARVVEDGRLVDPGIPIRALGAHGLPYPAHAPMLPTALAGDGAGREELPGVHAPLVRSSHPAAQHHHHRTHEHAHAHLPGRSLRLVARHGAQVQARGTRASAFLALLLTLAGLSGCRASGPLAVIHTAGGPVRVTLEVASTPDALAKGLMYRSALPDGHGMLFVFTADADHRFWMKNTLIPLDMLFIAADGRVVGIHADATPLSTAQVGVGRPSRYVLEVPGGYAARRGIATGDRVELVGVAVP
jgi:uncharacterized membrane protein (UPF0127 family)